MNAYPISILKLRFNQGDFYAVVDSIDMPRITPFDWHVKFYTTRLPYPQRLIENPAGGRRKPNLLASYVLGFRDQTPVYHRNGNPFDCRMANLSLDPVKYAAQPTPLYLDVYGVGCPFGFCNTDSEALDLHRALRPAVAEFEASPQGRIHVVPHKNGTNRAVRPMRVVGDLLYIDLGNGVEAVTDAAYLPLVQGINWNLSTPNGTVTTNLATIGGRQHTSMLHRLVIGAPPGAHVKHINGNKLDCRRANLCLKSWTYLDGPELTLADLDLT